MLKLLFTHTNLRKQKKGLGNKLIIALNICDISICILSMVNILSFNTMNRRQAELYIIVNDNNTTNKSIAEAVKRSGTHFAVWQIVCYTPFQFLVQVSCFLTVLLSATRMVAMVKPLYIIRQKMVWGALIIALIFLFSTAIGKWITLKTISDIMLDVESVVKMIKDPTSVDMKSWYVNSYFVMAEYFLVGVMVVVVAVCSGVTVRALNSPIVEVNDPGGRPDNSTNRRATVMILILSLFFVLINGTWITLYIGLMFSYMAKPKETDFTLASKEAYFEVNFIYLIMMPANSLINPVIYIVRNTGLNEYARMSVRRVGRVFWTVFQGIGNAAFVTGFSETRDLNIHLQTTETCIVST